jgi:glucose-6-phosphate 1-epimerase
VPASIEPIDFHGLPAFALTAPDGARALVTPYGAQLQAWAPAGGDERLYLSDRAVFERGSPIRGGAPVVFPQFSTFGSLPRHGFVRTLDWALAEQRTGADFASVTLRLTDSLVTRTAWPHAFALELTVSVGGDRLDLELEAENPGEQSFEFTCALHTYLRVAEIETTRLFGLRGLHYRDQLAGGKERAEQQESLVIDAPVDRIYQGPPGELMLREPARSLSIQSTHFTDVVVWNPWDQGDATLPDLPRTGFRRFLCVESAAISQPIALKPGDAWWGRQTLIAVR